MPYEHNTEQIHNIDSKQILWKCAQFKY